MGAPRPIEVSLQPLPAYSTVRKLTDCTSPARENRRSTAEWLVVAHVSRHSLSAEAGSLVLMLTVAAIAQMETTSAVPKGVGSLTVSGTSAQIPGAATSALCRWSVAQRRHCCLRRLCGPDGEQDVLTPDASERNPPAQHATAARLPAVLLALCAAIQRPTLPAAE